MEKLVIAYKPPINSIKEFDSAYEENTCEVIKQLASGGAVSLDSKVKAHLQKYNYSARYIDNLKSKIKSLSRIWFKSKAQTSRLRGLKAKLKLIKSVKLEVQFVKAHIKDLKSYIKK